MPPIDQFQEDPLTAFMDASHEDASEIGVDAFAAYELIPLPLLVTRVHDAKVLFVNRAFCRFEGAPASELLRVPANDFYAHASAREEMLAVLRAQSRLENYVVEARRYADNALVWVSLSIERIRVQGEACLCAMLTDVTEQVQANRASEQRFRLLTENARDILFCYEYGAGFTYVGPPVTRISGYTPEEYYANRKLYLDILAPDSRRHLQEFLRCSEATDGLQELQLQHRQGHIAWIEHRTSRTFDEKGKLIAATGIVRDITERKLAELATQRQAQEFRALAENSPDLIARLDRQFRQLYVNPAVVDVGTTPREAHLGRPLRSLLRSSSVADLLENAVRVVFSSGDTHMVEFEYETVSGPRVFESRLVPEFVEAGEVETVLAITHDVTDRVRAEQITRQANQLMQSVLDSLTAHVVVLDRAGCIKMSNQMWRQFHADVLTSTLGQPGEFLSTYLAQNVYLLPEQAEEIDVGITQVTHGDAAEYRCECAYWLPTGARWMLLSATPLGGSEQGAVVTLIDITDRKTREHEIEMLASVRRELRDSHSRAELIETTAHLLRRMLRSSEASIITRDAHTQESVVELALGGWSWSSGHRLAPGQGSSSIIFASGEPIMTENLAASGHAYHPHRYAPQQSALVVPLAINEQIVGTLSVGRNLGVAGNWPYIDSDLRLMTAIADVVAVSLMRATLYDQREQLFEVVDEGLVLLDARMRIMIANPAAQQHLRLLGGAERGEPLTMLTGRPLLEFVASPDRPPQEITVNTPETHTFEAVVYHLPQETESTGWVLVTRDVTVLRQLQEMNLQQERLAAVGQLAAGIAHDFNNKLGVIGLHTELLSHTAQLAEPHQKLLRNISKEVEEAGALVQKILDFSRRSVFARQPVSMGVLIQELVTMWQRTMPASIEIHFGQDKEVGDCTVMGDRARLRQALMNLALNARDAMPDGGSLSVSLEAAPPPAESGVSEGSAHEPGEWLCITIQDTGIGIAPDEQLHVFDPFFTTRSRSQHAGLGLSQVHGIVTQLNGFVQLESEEHVGTKVRVYFPLMTTSYEDGC